MPDFSDRLKELRKAKGLSQRGLGEAIGISERGIQNYELETNKPTSDIITKLADYFDVSADYLLGRSDNPQQY
ncbi:MAG: helix-turn-helix domain-containing protein [Defluviitaleaceae bacterium]|nr:helix-turn-helix domain-containing protein [Defluviitaleaceae bacterium]